MGVYDCSKIRNLENDIFISHTVYFERITDLSISLDDDYMYLINNKLYL